VRVVFVLSTVRHQMKARVKRIQQQVLAAIKDALDVPGP